MRLEASGHIQSLVLGSASIVIAIQIFFFGILAELLTINRQLLERLLTKSKKI